jgi:hypothetical protein
VEGWAHVCEGGGPSAHSLPARQRRASLAFQPARPGIPPQSAGALGEAPGSLARLAPAGIATVLALTSASSIANGTMTPGLVQSTSLWTELIQQQTVRPQYLSQQALQGNLASVPSWASKLFSDSISRQMRSTGEVMMLDAAASLASGGGVGDAPLGFQANAAPCLTQLSDVPESQTVASKQHNELETPVTLQFAAMNGLDTDQDAVHRLTGPRTYRKPPARGGNTGVAFKGAGAYKAPPLAMRRRPVRSGDGKAGDAHSAGHASGPP